MSKDFTAKSPDSAPPDFIALGLHPRDGTMTPTGTPVSQVTVETYLVGRHELGPSDPSNKGCRLWYSVTAPGETAPANPDDLRKSFFTKRKKDVIEFGFEDSGKTAHFAVQMPERPWGPLVSALIP